MSDRHVMRYAAYKESGVEWLGEVPEHWEVRRVKELGNLVLGKMLDNVQESGKFLKPYLKSKNIGWLKITDSNVEEMYFSVYEIALYRIRYGDLLFSEGGEVGKTAYWYDELTECYIQNSVHKFTTNKKNSSRYFLYLSFAAGHAHLYDSIVNFVSIKHLTKEKLVRVIWLVPPLPEQTAIAAYLDTKTAQIDRQVELLNKKATQYGKLKQSLINETVTRGLDRSVPMKESGVEWIGEVPAHWEVKRIKDISLIKRGASPRPIDDPIFFDEEGIYSWVRIADLSASERYLLNTKEKLSNLGASLSVKRSPGDFILSIAGTVGKPIITKIKCCIHDGFVWFPTLKLNPEFLYYLFSTGLPYQGLGKLGTQLNLNTEIVGLITIPIPPIQEIEEIVNYLDTKTAQIDRIVSTISNQIDKLKELRKTLINDVVTGKIKVT
jgi:type I restriction enzyme, S subunit